MSEISDYLRHYATEALGLTYGPRMPPDAYGPNLLGQKPLILSLRTTSESVSLFDPKCWELFDKILGALQYTSTEVDILELRFPADVERLQQELHPGHAWRVIFASEELRLDDQLNSIVPGAIVVPTVFEMLINPSLKKGTWEKLKPLQKIP